MDDNTGALSNFSDMWRALQSFHNFMKLPIELREMIWKLSLPRQFIRVRPSGYIFVPRPPVLLQVCQESRNLMMKIGRPCYFDTWTKSPSSLWLNPAIDVLYYTPYSTAGLPERHPIFERNLFNTVERVTLDRNNLFDFMNDVAPTMLSLKEVLVVLGDKGSVFSGNYWTSPTWQRQVFGEENWRLVHLDGNEDNKNAINRLICFLYRGKGGTAFGKALDQAHEEYKDGKTWTDIVENCEVEWLAGLYEALKERGMTLRSRKPRLIKSRSDINRDDSWTREALSLMPKLQPVFVLVDKIHYPSFIPARERQHHYEREYKQPRFHFHEEFNLWQRRR
ncbi:hypothetical protein PGQ11_001076 [Apiospora arundinis]|uniref:2EXR domain-containing protein n=1 Tax=Apiospora arundinis TaxID=335852 RepID=A0ABR2JMZ7_9PEZI